MTFTPFHLFCTTCQARLLVKHPSLVGQLLTCPKCQSMVYVEAPQNESLQDLPQNLPQGETQTQSSNAPEEKIEQKPQTEPNPQTQSPPESQPQSQSKSEPEPEEPLIRKRPKPYAKQSGQIILCCVLIGIVVLLAVVYISLVYRSDSPPDATAVAENAQENAPQNVQTAQDIQNAQNEIETEESSTDPNESALNEKLAHLESQQLNPTELQDIEPLDQVLAINDEAVEQEVASKSEEESNIENIENGGNTEITSNAESEITEHDPNLQSATAPQPILDLPMVHVEERLQLPLNGLESDRTTLLQAVRFLSDYGGVPITWDVPGMRLFGISLDEPIRRLNLTETTLGDALSQILQQNQLTFLIDNSQIFIYPQNAADATLKELRYDISDLVRSAKENETGPRLTVEQLLKTIPLLVAPSSWTSYLETQENPQNAQNSQLPGAGTIRADGSVLCVVQTEMNHREVFRFLEMIRTAKKIPLKSDVPSERIVPEHFAYQRLDQRITFHYFLETPLSEMLDLLSQKAKLKILVNHRVLNREQIPFDSLNGVVHVEDGTVRDALNGLLKSVNALELAYRIVDVDTVEITSYDSLFLPEMMSLESHFYGAKLHSQVNSEEQHTAEGLVEMLKNTISPESWSETTPAGGAILIDHASETFFVRQSQSVQQIIREWLKEE